MSERRWSPATVLLAFAGVALSFIFSSVYAQARLAVVNQAAADIARNASPSIEHLTAVRAGLREIQVVLDEAIDHSARGPGLATPSAAPDLGPIAALRAQLTTAFDAYMALPQFPDEPPLRDRLRQDRMIVKDALDRTVAVAARGQLEEATHKLRTEVSPAVERLDADLSKDIDLNASHSHDLALRIERARRHSLWVTLVFDGLSLLLTGVAAFLTLRAARQYAAFQEERRRILAQRADELEQFSGRVAHDILSPLSAVSLGVGYTLERTEDSRIRGMLERSRSALGRVSMVVDGLLGFARAGAAPEPGARTDVAALLDELVPELRAAAERVAVTLCCEPHAGTVACTPGVLTSLVSNLVHNAIKYIGDGPERRVTLRVAGSGPRIRIEVEDTGPGIPGEMGERIFQPYVRAAHSAQKGIGLGLATVKKLVDAHNGTIGYRSQPRRGTLFWVELPRRAPPI